MANAIKKISVQRGYDVTQYVLNVFGGAGGQHACAVADALGMTKVLIHPLAGVLSAYGIGLADIIAMREQAVEAPLTDDLLARLPALLEPLEADARDQVAAQGVPDGRITVAYRAHLRYQGTDTAVIVGVGSLAEMTAAFEAEYSRRFSFLMRAKPVIAEAVSVEVTGAQDELDGGASSTVRSVNRKAQPGELRAGPDVHRRGLDAGGAVPAIRAAARARHRRPGHHRRGTRHHRARAGLAGRGQRPRRPAAVACSSPPRRHRHRHPEQADPVMLEIFNNLFMSVAEQMGVRLQATSHSVNIKERLDFSCALFDAEGGLIANAPHMPVHLGSMGESIKMVIKRNRAPPAACAAATSTCSTTRTTAARTSLTSPSSHPSSPRPGPARRRRDLVLRGLAGAPRRDRGRLAGLDAGLEHPGRAGGGADRQLAARRGRPAPGGRDAPAAPLRRVPVPRPGHQPGRPARPDRRERQGHRRAAPHGRALRAGHGPGLHGPRAGERGRVGPAGDHRAARRGVRLRAGQRRGHPGRGTRRPRQQEPPRSTSPAPRRSCRTTSTRPPAWPWRPYSTCSGPW